MNNTVKYVILTVVFIAVIALVAVGYDYLSENYRPESEPEGETAHTPSNGTNTADNVRLAPDFQVLNEDGETVNLKDFFGKPIVVNFWATWCGPCKHEMPFFEDMYKKYGNEVAFLMVNLTDGGRDTIEKVNEFISENGYTFPVYYDTTYSAAITYNVQSIPMSLFINEKGEIVKKQIGAMNEETLEKLIEAIR